MRLIPAAVCALGAHALLYGTFRPADGLHGYLGWYEPGLAIVAVAVLLVFRPACLRTRLPIGDTARSLSLTTLLVLLAQESIERSVQAGQPAFAAMTPSEWLVLIVGVAATSLLLAFALRAGQSVIQLLRPPLARATTSVARWSVVTLHRGPARPLAQRFALRAPPQFAT